MHYNFQKVMLMHLHYFLGSLLKGLVLMEYIYQVNQRSIKCHELANNTHSEIYVLYGVSILRMHFTSITKVLLVLFYNYYLGLSMLSTLGVQGKESD